MSAVLGIDGFPNAILGIDGPTSALGIDPFIASPPPPPPPPPPPSAVLSVARLGDASSHGGTITSASSNVLANGVGVARAGDTHSCPVQGHGVTPLSSSSTVLANGRPVVRVGDTAGCGAVISRGSPNVTAG